MCSKEKNIFILHLGMNPNMVKITLENVIPPSIGPHILNCDDKYNSVCLR